MTGFTEAQRAELRDAVARSRVAAQDESRRRAAAGGRADRLDKPARVSSLPAAPPADTSCDLHRKETQVGHDPILDLPEAQPVIARLLSAVGGENAIDARAHVLRVAADVVRAKKHPRNPYAEATL